VSDKSWFRVVSVAVDAVALLAILVFLAASLVLFGPVELPAAVQIFLATQ
jgi:hypothetical protein